jgi:hypothetical protein
MKLQGADVLGAGWRAKGGKIQQPFFFSPFFVFSDANGKSIAIKRI